MFPKTSRFLPIIKGITALLIGTSFLFGLSCSKDDSKRTFDASVEDLDVGEADAEQDADGRGPEEPHAVSIQDLQNPQSRNRPFVGSEVLISGVSVSAGPNARSSLHVADEAGGPFSGVYVFNPRGSQHVSTEGIRIGTMVDVIGIYQETRRDEDAFGLSLTEVYLKELKKVGYQTPPQPHPVLAVQVAAIPGPTAEAFEGVLVDLGPVTVTEANLPGGYFEVNDQVWVGSLYHMHVAVTGQGLDHLRGVVHYENGHYVLMPRHADDVGADQTGIDTVTIRQIRDNNAQGHPETNSAVWVRNVVVTAGPNADDTYFHIQDTQGGAYRGLTVHNPHSRLDLSGIQPGALVDILGLYQEVPAEATTSLRSLSILSILDFEIEGEADVPAPEVVQMVQVAWGNYDTEIYEGTLIRLEDVNVVAPPFPLAEECIGCFPVSEDSVPGFLSIGTMYYNQEPDVGTSYGTVTGVLHYQYFPSLGNPNAPQAGAYILMPRNAADMQ